MIENLKKSAEVTQDENHEFIFDHRSSFGLLRSECLEGRGTVRYIPIEGGFYGIVCDDGKNYDPTNLPPEFQQDNLKVRFTGKILKDRVGFHMWGEIIEIKDISKSE